MKRETFSHVGERAQKIEGLSKLRKVSKKGEKENPNQRN